MKANEARFISGPKFCHSVFIAFSQWFFFFFSPRLLTESKQAEFIHKVRILMQLEKYDDAVSIYEEKNICSI